MGFLTSFVKNGEIRPSLCYKIILEQREERNQLVLCSEKTLALHFSSFNPHWPTLSLARGTNRQFYCTGVIIYNKTRQYFFCFCSQTNISGF